MERRSGVLLHPTSLPGRHGIGDLGRGAYRFVDFLTDCGQSLWQVLPLGPPGHGNSPYQCYSSMAGNPLLIDLEDLREQGLLDAADLDGAPDFPASFVDFQAVVPLRTRLLDKAARRFFAEGGGAQHRDYREFCEGKRFWLDHFAEFAAIKQEIGDLEWTEWGGRAVPDPDLVRLHKFIQFEFFRQWTRLRRYCHERGILLVGDIPIFVAHDSADVRAHPDLFDLDPSGRPRVIAGVPPDYFSATGQRWGNPLYRWDVMEESGFAWWIDRVRSLLELVDIIRLDHFRGFEKFYEIPAESETALHGRWVEGPGDRFFEALEKALGRLPFIAEDLGFITPEVHALRERWGLPGMRVLQFAFSNPSPRDPFKPHNYVRDCVVYTGTHDNDTTVGWFRGDGTAGTTRSAEQVETERRLAMRYLQSDGREIHWDFIRAALSSVADTAIFPMQDVLGLDSEARMNVPARAGNNWLWRFEEDRLDPSIAPRLRELTWMYGRLREG